MSKAARVAGVSKTTMHKWITKTGKVSATKHADGTYSIDDSEMKRLLDSLKQGRPKSAPKVATVGPSTATAKQEQVSSAMTDETSHRYAVADDDDDDMFNIFVADDEQKARPLNLGVYRHDTLQEVQHKADKYIADQEKRLLQAEVQRLKQSLEQAQRATEKAEERAESAWEKYDEAMQRVTRLLEDKREPAPRKRWLGLF